MARVKVLVEGYVSGKNNGRACCTITLVQDKKINMIVDPGTVRNSSILINALKKEKLTVQDIHFVFITHSHMDHYKNIALFPQAKVIDYWGIWHEDTVSEWKENFTSDLTIIKTPGHNYDSLTLLVKTNKGVVAIVGDVFWKKNFPSEDPYASDGKKLKLSRELVLKKADLIIPGHGTIFEVKK